jgi:glutamyl-tRNA synthetase
MSVRTRFAPSPTGHLHIGGARTALFSWAYAHKHGGKFILRIEDTDVERSTKESTQAILDAMHWLGLDYDEGPFYQMRRLDRYREVARQLIAQGHAYCAYETKEELDAMREAQRARGEKPRYNGRWRDSKDAAPNGIPAVVRFKNPLDGDVTWNDLVKGPISISNQELDDLVILRTDGVPTYNFGVVVDDIDMHMTHVIRGDDHVNNTPRQINIFKALGARLPEFAHVPMILGHDGERLSKRHGAVSVMQYRDDGYLPEALVNYLARLGWSHGDAEIFSVQQLIEWFDLAHISKSAARFDAEKLTWLNQQYIKEADSARLAELVKPPLEARGCEVDKGGPKLTAVIDLLKPRAATINELADAAVYFYRPIEPSADLKSQHLSAETLTVLRDLVQEFSRLEERLHGMQAVGGSIPLPCAQWTRQGIAELLKKFLAARKLKMGQIGVPLRVIVCGETQTPSLDATLALIGRDEVIRRMQRHLPPGA